MSIALAAQSTHARRRRRRREQAEHGRGLQKAFGVTWCARKAQRCRHRHFASDVLAEGDRTPFSFLISYEKMMQMLEQPKYARVGKVLINEDRSEAVFYDSNAGTQA